MNQEGLSEKKKGMAFQESVTDSETQGLLLLTTPAKKSEDREAGPTLGTTSLHYSDGFQVSTMGSYKERSPTDN